MVVRRGRAGDTAAITAIYNEGIRERGATFETRERDVDEIRAWFASEHHPLLVAEDELGGHVAGWIAASRYRDRECYRGIAEFSIYVAGSARARGVGDALMSAFIPALSEAGFWKVLSRIFPENSASRALCARHGFREVGVYQKHAQLDGEWRDVLVVERLLYRSEGR